MADRVANFAKGKWAHLGGLPEASDAIIVVLLKAAEADATLQDYDDLGALLAATGNTEADFTNYARHTALNVTVTVDDVNERIELDFDDFTIASAGGGTDNTLVKLLVCYDDDTGAGTDADIIVLSAHDFSATTDGNDLNVSFAATGVIRATD